MAPSKQPRQSDAVSAVEIIRRSPNRELWRILPLSRVMAGRRSCVVADGCGSIGVTTEFQGQRPRTWGMDARATWIVRWCVPRFSYPKRRQQNLIQHFPSKETLSSSLDGEFAKAVADWKGQASRRNGIIGVPKAAETAKAKKQRVSYGREWVLAWDGEYRRKKGRCTRRKAPNLTTSNDERGSGSRLEASFQPVVSCFSQVKQQRWTCVKGTGYFFCPQHRALCPILSFPFRVGSP